MTERPLETGWLPDTPVDDTLLRQFLENQIEVTELFASNPAGRVERTDRMAAGDTGGPIAYFNQAILVQPLSGPSDAVLDEVEAFYAPATADGRGSTLLSIWPTPDLSGRGWSLAGHPAIVARPPGPHPPANAPEVEVVSLGPGETDEYERVMIEGYPMPEAAGLPGGSLIPTAAMDAGLTVRVARVGGEAVATATGYAGHGIVNLCGAATLPAARRKGAWGALVWARVDDAPDLPAVAYTSDYSRPGFLHLGFLVITRFTLWYR